MQYVAAIDGLRAIAVLLVVLFHAGVPLIPNGFVGVDIFFVISGFLISSLILDEVKSSQGFCWTAFYARRIRRIIPALLVVICVSLLGACILLFPQELPQLGRSTIALGLFASNMHFLKNVGGYFDQSADLQPLLHTWSLSVEEQFYFIWPLILLLAVRYIKHVKFFLMCVLSISIIIWFYDLDNNFNYAFYLMPLRAWEFAAGALVSQIRISSGSRTVGFFYCGISLLIISQGIRDAVGLLIALPVILSVWGAVLILCSTSDTSRSFLTLPAMVWVGKRSYGWYLWHWPLLAIARSYALGSKKLSCGYGHCGC